jgi:hypothetical protein
LTKIAGMEPSSKRRRTSSKKKSGAEGARVISVKRADMLPRKGVAAAGQRETLAEPLLDAPTEPVAKAIASSRKRVRRPEQTETIGSRTKPARAAGRASVKPKKPAAKEVTPLAPAVVPETVEVATPSAVVGLAAVETETVVEASAILEETTIATPVAPAAHPAKRGLVRTVSRLLSSLLRWTAPRV